MGALIAYKNLADDAVLSIRLGDPIAEYPIENAQERQLSKIAMIKRDSGTNRAQLHVDLGAVKDINFIGIISENFDASGAPGIFPADFRAYYSTDDVSYDSGTFSTTDMIGDQANLDIPANSFLIYPARVSARYLRIDLSYYIVGNTYAFGRLWIGDSIIFPDGVIAQFDLDFIDSGTLESSAGLQAYEDRNQRVRILRCAFPEKDITSLIAFGYADDGSGSGQDLPSLQGLQLEAGLTGEVVLLPRTPDPLWTRRLGIYGHIDSSGRPVIRHVKGGYYSCSVTVVEER